MPRRPRRPSPLPARAGVPAARVRMPVLPGAPPDPAGAAPWATVVDFLVERTGDRDGVRRRVADGEVLLDDGSLVTEHTAYRGGSGVHLHRDLPQEQVVPDPVTVLHRDERILVVDKPHFLATMPRGSHVAQTVLVRLRAELDLPDLTPAHRLDRLTAGVLLLVLDPGLRAAYQGLFADRQVEKTYLAVAPFRADLDLPVCVRDRLVKPRGSLQTQVVPGEPNACTRVELVGRRGSTALYRLRPLTGRTHQLRVHLAGLGIPILHDPLYPQVLPETPGELGAPLQLLAAELSFTDPVTGQDRTFSSRRGLAAWPAGAPGPRVPGPSGPRC